MSSPADHTLSALSGDDKPFGVELPDRNLSAPQFLHEQYAVRSRPKDAFSDNLLAGTLRQHRYPDGVGEDERFYHGTNAELLPGEYIEAAAIPATSSAA